MTGSASVFGAGRAAQVLRMIELHVEAFFEPIREGLARRIVSVDVLMTDRAHGNIRRCELRQVTTGAIFVSGKTWP